MKRLNLKIILLILILFLKFNCLNSQTLEILRVDDSQYPLIKASIKVKDTNNNEIRSFDINDFKIFDGGKSKDIKNITCNSLPKKFSVVITMDKTASMLFNPKDLDGTNTQPPLKRTIAVNFAKNLISSLDTNFVEIGLTEFSSGITGTRQTMFFSKNKDSLQSVISKTSFSGGTDINSGFLGRSNNRGSLNLAEFSLYKPIVVFLTDGQHDPQFSQNKELAVNDIITKANNIDASIFVIGIGYNINSEMDFITQSTNGKLFKNVDNENLIDNITKEIIEKSESMATLPSCEIEWIADCDGGNIELSYEQGNKPKVNYTYNISQELLPKFSFTPRYLKMREDIEINKTKYFDIILTATNKDVIFDGYSSDSDKFKVYDWGGSELPLTIKSNESKKIKLSYTSTDSLCNFGTIIFNSNSCSYNKFDFIIGNITIDDIDLGNTLPNVEKTLNFTNKFCNNSCDNFFLTNYGISGVDSSDFELILENTILENGSCLNFEIKYHPKSEKISKASYYFLAGDSSFFSGNIIGSSLGTSITKYDDNTLTILYPNPTSNIINCSYYNIGIEEKVSISIYDQYSKLITELQENAQTGNNIYTIDLSQYANGIYYVVLNNKINTYSHKISLIK